MTRRRVDTERFERADREAKIAIEAERQSRIVKTARLREERLSVEQAVEKPPRGQASASGRKGP